MIAHRVILVLFLIKFVCIPWICAEPVVKILEGKLSGMIQQTRNGRKFSSFLGIPYAEPPIKDLRFKSPVPAKLWNGVRMANADGNECPQMRGTEIVGSEDCLYLNVFTPSEILRSSKANVIENHHLLPVMVWIHGGAFVGGSSNSSIYNPGYLLDKDIVLVTLNYRLGIFGFLSTGNRVAPGNFGLKDQVLALKWVQRNIKAFGGDSNRVTLFAQSAGAASVNLHALSKASTGLFHQYITQSGSALDPWAYQKRSYFKHFVHQLAFLVGCPAIFSKTLIECLRTKKVDQLLSTSSVFGTIARFAQLTWTPTDEPESEDAFLTDSPENLIAKNEVKDCPFITGNVVNEGFFITELMYSNEGIYDTIRFGLDLILNYFSSYYLKPRSVFRFTSQIKDFYLSKSIFSTKDEFIRGITRFLTDGFFLYPEMKLVDTLSSKLKSPVYFYNFGYEGAESIFKTFQTQYGDAKVGHAEELTYIFPQNSVQLRGSDTSTSEIMVDLWTSFAINGTPTSNLLPNPNMWTPYKDNTSYLEISGSLNKSGPGVTLKHSYFPERMNFWKKNSN